MPTTVFYATNRAPIAGATIPPYYGLDATTGAEAILNMGVAEVTTAAAPEAARQILAVTPDPATSGRGAAPAVNAWAQAAIAAQQDAVLFIHGYGNSWTDSILRAGQLRDFYAEPDNDTARPVALLAFGWPSDGKVFPPSVHYPADRRDAEAAGPALASLFGQVAKVAAAIRAKGLKLHVIAHSMGNWALRHGLKAFGPPAGVPLFDECVLAAADEDADALTADGKLPSLSKLAKRVTAYVYGDDGILFISQAINGTTRLGQVWPTRLPRAAAARDDAAIRVNACIVEQGDPNLTGHQYYRNNPTVRRDIIAVLEGRPQAVIRSRQPEPGADARLHNLFGPPVVGPPMV